MKKPAVSWPFLALALAVALPAVAAAPVRAQEPGAELTVYLLTMGVGDQVHERFGHNAILIRDAARGTDTAYNWGEFDFDSPGFIRNFLKGRMLYQMSPHPLDQMLYAYRHYNRTVQAQELNLTNAEKLALQQFVEWNALPENKRYLYDYYRDNCSTRVRDALDRVLGGALRQQLDAQPANTTYRQETIRLMLVDIPVLTGMNLAMGPFIDQPLTKWDDAFIPMKLRDQLREVTVAGPNGERVPLVKQESTLFQATREEPPDQAPNLLAGYIIGGLLIAGLFLLFGLVKPRWARIVFNTLAGFWSLLLGLLGTIILALWLFTDHVVTFNNQNVLLANPLSLVLLVAVLGLWLGRSWGYMLMLRTSLVIAGLALLGLAMKIVPGMEQANADIIALLLPPHLALAFVIVRGGEAHLRKAGSR